MERLTRKQERLLRRTANGVRIWVTSVIFLTAVLSVRAALKHYAPGVQTTDIPEIPLISTLGNIAGIYLPLFAVVAAYVWATRAAPTRNLAPNGFAMALFRDAFTWVVLTTMLLAPWLSYRTKGRIVDVHPFLIWYQAVLPAVVGGAFVYYFHGHISTEKAEEGGAGPAAAAAPKRKAPRRRPKEAPAVPETAAAPELVPAVQGVEA
ncbi:MAG TPA: hypothetical protein VFR37_17140 [Longimicrobium sp.]|nr:hypothetical protein [Longimicrobium sp.]